MNYSSTSIDRRAAYYARTATLIAANPQDFYARAENGRKFQTSRLNWPPATKPEKTVTQ
jgi:hypothetical protein